MTTTAKLVAATQNSYTSLMTTELDSLASGKAVMGSTAIDNGTNLDLEVAFSFVGGGSITTTGAPFLALYLYPLNGDNATYGDNRFGSATTAVPPNSYFVAYMGPLAAQSATVYGTFFRPDGQGPLIRLPRGSWKPVLYSSLGVAMSSSGNILYYRTTNIQFV